MKKKSSAMQKPSTIDPFKIRQFTVVHNTDDVLVPTSPDVSISIDAWRKAHDQALFLEAEARVHRDTVVDYAQSEYAERLFNDKHSNFKLQGNEAVVTYIAQDASASLTGDERDAFAKAWGRKAADDLIERDLGSLRFNTEVLENNFDVVMKALRTIPADILSNLFRPISLKAKKDAANIALEYASNPSELKEIMKQLRLINFIR